MALSRTATTQNSMCFCVQLSRQLQCRLADSQNPDLSVFRESSGKGGHRGHRVSSFAVVLHYFPVAILSFFFWQFICRSLLIRKVVFILTIQCDRILSPKKSLLSFRSLI